MLVQKLGKDVDSRSKITGRNSYFREAGVIVAWLYTASISLWFILHSWLGDTIWWLALLNAFTPYFFVPLALILPICLFVFRRRSVRASAVLPLIIFLLLYGHLFLPSWSSVSTTEETSLTIMSFNIWGYSQSRETAQAILDGETPDVVVLQELAPEMAEVLIDELGGVYPYSDFSFGANDYGLGIFSRYPLAELDSSGLSDPNWLVQIHRIEVSERSFILYNVHLQVSNVLAYLETDAPIAFEVETSFRNRESQARRLIADTAKQKEPVVVAGDFNSTDQSETYRILTDDLTDAHQAVGWGFGHTFPAYAGNFRGIPIIPGQMRIDMVFYSKEFSAVSTQVGRTYGESDHLPVLAHLTCCK